MKLHVARGRFLPFGVAAATLAIVALVVLTRSGAVGPIDPETVAIRAATEGALRALQETDTTPASYAGGPLPSEVAASMRARVVSDMGRFFTPRLQARYQQNFLDAIDQIGQSEWDAESALRYDWTDAASVVGDRAVVHVTETGWVVRRGGQFGTRPDASHRLDWIDDWTVMLVRTGGEWRVDEVDFSCRSGCP